MMTKTTKKYHCRNMKYLQYADEEHYALLGVALAEGAEHVVLKLQKEAAQERHDVGWVLVAEASDELQRPLADGEYLVVSDHEEQVQVLGLDEEEVQGGVERVQDGRADDRFRVRDGEGKQAAKELPRDLARVRCVQTLLKAGKNKNKKDHRKIGELFKRLTPKRNVADELSAGPHCLLANRRILVFEIGRNLRGVSRKEMNMRIDLKQKKK